MSETIFGKVFLGGSKRIGRVPENSRLQDESNDYPYEK